MGNTVSDEWKVVNVFLPSRSSGRKVVKSTSRSARGLVKKKALKDFYFNKYKSKDSNYVKFGFYQMQHDAEAKLSEEMAKKGKVSPGSPDLKQVDGVVLDQIKCSARKVSELVSKEFNGSPTVLQSVYLIHFLLNQLFFSYEDELKLYKIATDGIKKRLGK